MNASIQGPGSTDDANRTPPLTIFGKAVVILGAVLFTASYFLPAVHVEAGNRHVYSGLEAAQFTVGSLAALFFSPVCILLFVTGLPNILAPTYTLLRLLRRWEAAQANCVLGSIAGSIIVWPVFLLVQGVPLVGYFTWLVGIALLLAPATGLFDIRKTD